LAPLRKRVRNCMKRLGLQGCNRKERTCELGSSQHDGLYHKSYTMSIIFFAVLYGIQGIACGKARRYYTSPSRK